MGESAAELMRALKSASEAEATSRMVDVLSALKKTKMTVEMLDELRIGAVVAKLRKHEDATVADLSKQLVRKWKEVAAAAGVTESTKKIKPEKKEETAVSVEGTFTTIVSDFRDGSRRKLVEVLQMERANSSVTSHKMAEGIEEAMAAAYPNADANPAKKKEYVAKLRQLCFNLKKNRGLGDAVMCGDVAAEKLVAMSVEELATPQQQAEREAMRDFQREAKSLDWDKRNRDRIMKSIGVDESKGMFQCGKCKSKRISNHAKQTRSADEPMTQFFECADCGNRWRF